MTAAETPIELACVDHGYDLGPGGEYVGKLVTITLEAKRQEPFRLVARESWGRNGNHGGTRRERGFRAASLRELLNLAMLAYDDRAMVPSITDATFLALRADADARPDIYSSANGVYAHHRGTYTPRLAGVDMVLSLCEGHEHPLYLRGYQSLKDFAQRYPGACDVCRVIAAVSCPTCDAPRGSECDYYRDDSAIRHLPATRRVDEQPYIEPTPHAERWAAAS